MEFCSTHLWAISQEMLIKLIRDMYSENTFLKCLQQAISYSQTSNVRSILVGNTILDHSDVVGASPVGAAPTTSSFST